MHACVPLALALLVTALPLPVAHADAGYSYWCAGVLDLDCARCTPAGARCYAEFCAVYVRLDPAPAQCVRDFTGLHLL